MIKFWALTILFLIIITLIISKLTLKYYKKENSEKMMKEFGIKTRYWQGVILVSLLLTFLVMFLLKRSNILTF
jgi:hypothetical protein